MDPEARLLISEKIALMGERPGKIEARVDNWLANFLNLEEKHLALKLFLNIDYFSEERIEKILEIYRVKISQHLTDRGMSWGDVIIVTPGGNADSSHAHAYKLTKRWSIAPEAVISGENIDNKISRNKLLIFLMTHMGLESSS